jgi:hypothetical protein
LATDQYNLGHLAIPPSYAACTATPSLWLVGRKLWLRLKRQMKRNREIAAMNQNIGEGVKRRTQRVVGALA